MRTIRIASMTSAAALGLLLLTAATPPTSSAPPPAPAPAAVAPSTSNCLAPPFLVKQGSNAYTTPKDFAAIPRQGDANCLAWQEFISLNWVAASTMRGQPDTTVTPQQFGTANDTRPVVWETYKESDEVFLANAAKPPAWNSWVGGSSLKALGGMKSETDPEPTLDLSDIGQASIGSPWLTAQSHYITLYERRMNQDEFNYIVTNQLYNANMQLQYVQVHPVPPTTTGTQPPLPPVGLSLPDGTAATSGYGPLGSIETKAAWIELDNPNDWPRYKTSKAVVAYPGPQWASAMAYAIGAQADPLNGLLYTCTKAGTSGHAAPAWNTTLGGTTTDNSVQWRTDKKPSKTVTVGLVGLHIIHKTALGQQFIWATFEHVDNCPDVTQVSAKTTKPYTYYNPKCDPKTDAYACKVNANPSTYKPAKPYSAPIQVVRSVPVPTRANNNVAGLNQYVWGQIKAANSKSVYLNYMLVNTLWSNQNTTIAPGARVPLYANQLSPAPNQEAVSNATLETYVQNVTCLFCHASADIASTTPQSTTKIFNPATAATALNPYASDYSFLFDNAQTPAANKGNH